MGASLGAIRGFGLLRTLTAGHHMYSDKFLEESCLLESKFLWEVPHGQ